MISGLKFSHYVSQNMSRFIITSVFLCNRCISQILRNVLNKLKIIVKEIYLCVFVYFYLYVTGTVELEIQILGQPENWYKERGAEKGAHFGYTFTLQKCIQDLPKHLRWSHFAGVVNGYFHKKKLHRRCSTEY